MAKKKAPPPSVELYLAHKVAFTEITQAEANMTTDFEDYDGAIDLIENVRADKDYDWMSNIAIPEYASHFLTQAAIDANTYFQTRDFVEVYHQDETPEAETAAEANKNLINRTLNQRYLRHYSKYMRAKLLCNSYKQIVARCWWEQETKTEVIGRVTRMEKSTTQDIYGNPLIYEDQTPMMNTYEEDVEGEVPVVDRFNWDVIDPRNVFFDNTYAYSLQDKEWVTIRIPGGKTLAQLEAEAKDFDYINLEKLREIPPPEYTESYQEADNKRDDWQLAGKNYKFDIYERHGLEWCVVEEVNEFGNPTVIKYGYDDNGEVLEDAQLHELILTVAVSGAMAVLIRFTPQKFEDSTGKRYRPIIRGLNYIHPSKDGGIGDAKYSEELQVFINDTVNMSNDRVKLATLPTLKGNKYSLEDNDTVYFAPEHVIELINKDDLEEFEIKSDISGAAQMLSLGQAMMQQVNAKYPTTMGNTPGMASTTATAVAGAEQRTNARESYRGLTWEYTFLTDLYWMITQMTHQFAMETTALRLFGNEEMLLAFRPDYEFFYKPVTGAIETEYSKGNKIKEGISILQMVSQSPNPNAAKVVNLVLVEIFELWGMDKKKYAAALMEESQPMTEQSGPASGSEQTTGRTSNQNLVPMTGMEQNVRGI